MIFAALQRSRISSSSFQGSSRGRAGTSKAQIEARCCASRGPNSVIARRYDQSHNASVTNRLSSTWCWWMQVNFILEIVHGGTSADNARPILQTSLIARWRVSIDRHLIIEGPSHRAPA